MKIQQLAISAVATVCVISASAGLVVDTTAPTDVVKSAAPDAASFTRVFDDPANANHGRGMTFTTPDNGGETIGMESITIRKSAAQSYTAGQSLTLYVFEGTTAEWNLGDGDSDGDIWNLTGISNVPVSQSFDIGGLSFADGDYVHFNMDAPVALNENTSYGWLLLYDNAGSGNAHFEIAQGAWTSQSIEQQIQLKATANALGNSTTPLEYYVSIPEPATLGLVAAFGGGILFIRRKLMI